MIGSGLLYTIKGIFRPASQTRNQSRDRLMMTPFPFTRLAPDPIPAEQVATAGANCRVEEAPGQGASACLRGEGRYH